MPDFSPAQPWQLFHPPALSLQGSLFTQGRAFSQARPQRVTKDAPSKLARYLL